MAEEKLDARSDAAVLREVYRLENEAFDVPLDAAASLEMREVVYGSVRGRDLTGTLYLPAVKTGARAPSVVYLHGGGWLHGSPRQFARHAAAMAAKGFAGLCVGYRFSAECPYPAAIQDAKCAVRYLRANADRFGLDPARIGAVGGSAGAHLSACLATTGRRQVPEWEGAGGHADFDNSIQAAVLFNGEFDLPASWQYGKCNDFMLRFLGQPYEKAPALYREASPVHHVDGDTCPCLLIHGEEDDMVPVSQSIDFHKQILSAGGHSEIITVPRVGHAWFNGDPHFKPCLEAMMTFLLAQLGESKRRR